MFVVRCSFFAFFSGCSSSSVNFRASTRSALFQRGFFFFRNAFSVLAISLSEVPAKKISATLCASFAGRRRA